MSCSVSFIIAERSSLKEESHPDETAFVLWVCALFAQTLLTLTTIAATQRS